MILEKWEAAGQDLIIGASQPSIPSQTWYLGAICGWNSAQSPSISAKNLAGGTFVRSHPLPGGGDGALDRSQKCLTFPTQWTHKVSTIVNHQEDQQLKFWSFLIFPDFRVDVALWHPLWKLGMWWILWYPYYGLLWIFISPIPMVPLTLTHTQTCILIGEIPSVPSFVA